MPAGRPSKYKPEFCEQVIDLGKAGKSQVQIAVELGIPRTTMLSWADAHEEFSTALTRAKECEQAWWEDQAQNGKAQELIGASVWAKSVAARFRDDYTERQKVDMNVTSHEDALAELE